MNGVVTGGVRLWLKAEGLVALTLSAVLYWHLGLQWWIFFALLLAPDLAMLGYVIDARIGSVAYNVVHSYVLPLCLAIFAVATNRARLDSFICIWTAHIGMDRALGYGLKYSTAFADTHLGVLGKTSRATEK